MKSPSTFAPAYDLASLREKFEVTRQGLIFLNHAGMSPLPLPVKQAMTAVVEAIASEGSEVFATVMEPISEELPVKVGKLVNAEPDEVAFVENTSTGLNIIAQSLPLHSGDNVLLCDVEFPSNVYPWQNLGARGVETRLLSSNGGGLSLEAVDAARDSHSRIVAVSAIQFFTGYKQDLAALGAYCNEHGLWLIVDAIQAAGVMPIDMKAMGISALVAGGQKALLAPPGQGLMVIRHDVIDQMSPIFVGPVSVVDYEHWLHYDMTLRPGARRFDMGTSNIVGLAGLLAAVNLLLDIGVEHILEWVTYLSDVAIDDLQSRGYRVVTPAAPSAHAHIVTFAWDGDPRQAVAELQSKGIILRSHQDAAGRDYLRISTHAYNTVDEVIRVGSALEEIEHE